VKLKLCWLCLVNLKKLSVFCEHRIPVTNDENCLLVPLEGVSWSRELHKNANQFQQNRQVYHHNETQKPKICSLKKVYSIVMHTLPAYLVN
jgi:hypothetical protein